MELAIDTSNEIASAAVAQKGRPIAEVTWRAGYNHTATLLDNVVHILRCARGTLRDVDTLVVAKGPGSFNGVRVAISCCKGLSMALGIPLVGVGTLEVEAFPYADTLLPICPVMEAGKGDLATALFHLRNGEWQRLREERIRTLEELVSETADTTLFCGNISRELHLQLTESLGHKARVVHSPAGVRRAGYLAQLGWMRIQRGELDQLGSLQPLYLKRPSITVSRKSGGLG